MDPMAQIRQMLQKMVMGPQGMTVAPQTPQAGMQLGADWNPFQARERLFNNMRSPEVRRDVGGNLIDENRKTGIDQYEGHAHSWDQPKAQGYVNTPAELADAQRMLSLGTGDNSMHVGQAEMNTGENGRALMSPYGGGYSPFPHADIPGVQPMSMVKSYKQGDPLLDTEKDTLQNNVQASFNDSYAQPLPHYSPSSMMSGDMSGVNNSVEQQRQDLLQSMQPFGGKGFAPDPARIAKDSAEYSPFPVSQPQPQPQQSQQVAMNQPQEYSPFSSGLHGQPYQQSPTYKGGLDMNRIKHVLGLMLSKSSGGLTR